MTTYIKHSIYLIIFLFSFNFTSLIAQDIKSNTKGFSLSLSGSIASWDSQSLFLGDLSETEPSGLGIYARVAYGINQNIEVFLAYSALGYKQEFDWDSFNSSTLFVGGRYNFGATLRRFRPFLEGALAINNMTVDPITFDSVNIFKLEVSGVGGTFGGGVHFFIIPALSVSAHGNYSFGNFNTISLSGEELTGLDENVDFGLLTINLGVTYFFN